MNRIQKVFAAGVGTLALSSSAFAGNIQYIVIAKPFHMAQYTQHSERLICPNGDFAISAGSWFQAGGKVVKFPQQGGAPGSVVPILDNDGDGSIGYQINVQNDGVPASLFCFVQCLHIDGEAQQP